MQTIEEKEMSKKKSVLCPTCKQDMQCAPREGKSKKDCPQCGQGLTIYRARILSKTND